MDLNDVRLTIANDKETTIIHLPVEKEFKYRMDNTALMVCEDDTPKVGNVAGFYKFRYANYDNIDTNNINTGSATGYDFSEQTLFDYPFKTYLLKYRDQTVNRVFIFKVKDDIIGQVEIQKIGARDWNEYDQGDVEPFLYFLVNTQVERKEVIEKEKKVDKNAIKNARLTGKVEEELHQENVNIDIDAIINNLHVLSKTSKILIILAISSLVVGLVLAVITGYWLILLLFLPLVLILAGIVVHRILVSKKNLSKFDLNEVRNDLRFSCKAFDSKKTYFTNLYLLTNYYEANICMYRDIVWIYPRDKYYQGIKIGTDIIINLSDGQKMTIPYNDEFLKIIEKHTSDILLGNTLENKREYKEIIKDLK